MKSSRAAADAVRPGRARHPAEGDDMKSLVERAIPQQLKHYDKAVADFTEAMGIRTQ